MRRVFRLLLEFAALSVPLTWLWLTWAQEPYTELVGSLGAPLLERLGAAAVPESPAEKRFVSYVPFLVLILVTPRLSLRRRLAGLAAGCGILFLAHLGLLVVEAFAQTPGRPTEDSFSTVFPAAMFVDALPFALWAVVAQEVLRDAFRRALGVAGGGGA
jgi:hypothetical protein